MYYKRLTIFKSLTDPAWSQRYLTSPPDRITALLKDFLGNDFWENYSHCLTQAGLKSELLLRVKIAYSDCVILYQIWSSETVFKAYLQKAVQGLSLSDLLLRKNISVEEHGENVDLAHITHFLSSLKNENHILQYICPEWKTADMTIGDPLKQGRNYLPNP